MALPLQKSTPHFPQWCYEAQQKVQKFSTFEKKDEAKLGLSNSEKVKAGSFWNFGVCYGKIFFLKTNIRPCQRTKQYLRNFITN